MQHQVLDHMASITEQIRTRAGDDVLQLANQLVNDAYEQVNEEHDELLRAIGWMLTANGRQDLWLLAYLEANKENLYIVGDEVRFLLREERAAPTPLEDSRRVPCEARR